MRNSQSLRTPYNASLATAEEQLFDMHHYSVEQRRFHLSKSCLVPEYFWATWVGDPIGSRDGRPTLPAGQLFKHNSAYGWAPTATQAVQALYSFYFLGGQP